VLFLLTQNFHYSVNIGGTKGMHFIATFRIRAEYILSPRQNGVSVFGNIFYPVEDLLEIREV